MRYVEAPTRYFGGEPAVYLAGGITDCPDWQAEVVAMLVPAPVAILNPRRRNFCVSDRKMAAGQIRWEFEHIRRADVVLFWFTEGPSPQPIALYELGAAASTGRSLAVGAHPGYVRRNDVLLQLALVRPELVVHSTLPAVVAESMAQLELLFDPH
jgi:hypothetical protein